MKSVCVFCASSAQVDERYLQAAQRIGATLARLGLCCVYGAGKAGLMGRLADGVISGGGRIVGVIPQKMVDHGLAHPSLSQTIVTPTMSVRKERMLALADMVVALPGGVGTLEELLDTISWKRLGLIDHKIIIFNQDGFYNPLLQMLLTTIDERFMPDGSERLWTVADTPEQLEAELEKA